MTVLWAGDIKKPWCWVQVSGWTESAREKGSVLRVASLMKVCLALLRVWYCLAPRIWRFIYTRDDDQRPFSIKINLLLPATHDIISSEKIASEKAFQEQRSLAWDMVTQNSNLRQVLDEVLYWVRPLVRPTLELRHWDAAKPHCLLDIPSNSPTCMRYNSWKRPTQLWLPPPAQLDVYAANWPRHFAGITRAYISLKEIVTKTTNSYSYILYRHFRLYESEWKKRENKKHDGLERSKKSPGTKSKCS